MGEHACRGTDDANRQLNTAQHAIRSRFVTVDPACVDSASDTHARAGLCSHGAYPSLQSRHMYPNDLTDRRHASDRLLMHMSVGRGGFGVHFLAQACHGVKYRRADSKCHGQSRAILLESCFLTLKVAGQEDNERHHDVSRMIRPAKCSVDEPIPSSNKLSGEDGAPSSIRVIS